MPKRKNRLKAIEHERRQMDMLKDLEPNATPEEYLDLSNFLLDIVQEALAEVYDLETGEPPDGSQKSTTWKRGSHQMWTACSGWRRW